MTGSGRVALILMIARSLFAIEGHDLRHVSAAIVQGAAERIDAFDHMMVGDDVAPLIHDHAGSHAIDLAAFSGGEQGVAVSGFLAVDVDGRAF